MFRIYRKTIFPRWHTKRQKPVDKKQNTSCPKALVYDISSQRNNYSDSNHKEKKQHADKQDKRFWDDPQFHNNFLHSSLFETAGWLGTAALCFNYHLKYINNVLEYDRIDSSCLFSNIVLAMPRRSSHKEKSPFSSSVPDLAISSKTEQNPEKESVLSDIVNLGSIRQLTDQYAAAVQNVAGVRNISKSDKKAFRYFQTAARLGSSQALYNLGLCYQLGKGTKVNFNMAAFYYRKAAMKGHGLASFNLAGFFLRGLGGLPVDSKLAKELLAQAAEKGVPEAQVYFGIEYLENKRWLEATRIFSSLAGKNIPVGQYYLGLCYENGFGVKRNEMTAVELYSKSAAQGNEKAAYKLTAYQNKSRNDIKESLKSTVMLKGSGLHVSLSVPELGAVMKESNQSHTKVSILSHLDLITPFLLVKDNYKSNCNDDLKITKEYPSTFLPFRHISLVTLQIKM